MDIIVENQTFRNLHFEIIVVDINNTWLNNKVDSVLIN